MKKILLYAFLFLSMHSYSQFSHNWKMLNPCPGQGRLYATSTSNGKVALAGGGLTAFSGNTIADFYLYNIETDIWTAISNFPGGVRENLLSFSVNGRLFAGMGTSFIAFENDLYEYDLAKGEWAERTSMPGSTAHTNAFVVNGKAYVIPSYLNDNTQAIVSYDPVLDDWDIVTPYDVTTMPRGPIGFSSNGKIYFGSGPTAFSSTTAKHWYVFDPADNSVTRLNDLPTATDQSACFAINDTGFMYNVGGNDFALYMYQTSNDEWIYLGNPGPNRRSNASAFSGGGKGYVVFGEITSTGNKSTNELMEITLIYPEVKTSIGNSHNNPFTFRYESGNLMVSVPSAARYNLQLYSITGQCLKNHNQYLTEGDNNIEIDFKHGLNLLKIINTETSETNTLKLNTVVE